jgi:hypothetical protein
MNRHLKNPDSWKTLDIHSQTTSKCLCIYTLGKWKLSPRTWQRLLTWLSFLNPYGIFYDVSTPEKGRLHFTLHQCSGFTSGPFSLYDGQFLETVLQQLSGLHIIFRGLLVTPTGLALRGYPSTNIELQKLMKTRDNLASFFQEAGVPFEPPYTNDICHATLFRWTVKPSAHIIEMLEEGLQQWNEAILADLTPLVWNFGYGTLLMRSDEIVSLSKIWTPLKIAHRGLTDGPNHSSENSIETIRERCKKGLASEIDIWWKDNAFWIGHDSPREPVSLEFLCSDYLWIHAKHMESFYELQRISNEQGLGLRIFYHTDEDYVLTTHGDTIIYPGLDDVDGWTYMMPEMCTIRPSKASAICSDFTKIN